MTALAEDAREWSSAERFTRKRDESAMVKPADCRVCVRRCWLLYYAVEGYYRTPQAVTMGSEERIYPDYFPDGCPPEDAQFGPLELYRVVRKCGQIVRTNCSSNFEDG